MRRSPSPSHRAVQCHSRIEPIQTFCVTKGPKGFFPAHTLLSFEVSARSRRERAQQPAETRSGFLPGRLTHPVKSGSRRHDTIQKRPWEGRLVPTTRRTLLLLLAYSVALTGLPATSQTLLTTVATGSQPVALAINLTTKKVYVANQNSNTVTVIDEATDSTSTIPVGSYPTAIAVNPATNKIYVANQYSNNVRVIDGAWNSTTVVATGGSPQALAVNSVTNKIYVANYHDNSVTVINGANNSTSTVGVGRYPTAVGVNLSTNKIYVANLNSN